MEPIKIQTFLGGICDIYRLGSSGQPERIYDGIPLDNRTVGSRRAFDAMQAGHTIAKVVRIPVIPCAFNDCFAVVNGRQFSILQVQEIMDTSPKCLQLTLEQPDILWALEQGES